MGDSTPIQPDGSEADSLLAGRIYVLIATSHYPDGEIRTTLDVE